MTSTSDPSQRCPDRAIEQTYGAEWGRLLALLVSRTRRLDLAEDALCEAFARAAARWPNEGIPANPAGWLYTTASRLVAGRRRAEAIAGRKAPLLAIGRSWTPPALAEGSTNLPTRSCILFFCVAIRRCRAKHARRLRCGW